MSGLFTLLIIGLVIYMLFSKNGAMACCGGHHDQQRPSGPHRRDAAPPSSSSAIDKGAVIDLGKDDYQVLSADDNSDRKIR